MALIDLGNIVIISNDLTVVVNFPTWSNDCDSHSPALFDFFLFSDAGICYTVALLSLGNHDHVLVSVSIDFPSNSKRDAPFPHTAYNNFRAGWGDLHNHLGDVSCKDIFKLGTSAAGTEFVSGSRFEMIYVPSSYILG